ncbi:MAG: PhoH family protein [Bacteroidetes bacterium]|nr:PhoH family protein [Bacteroidota bacterium]
MKEKVIELNDLSLVDFFGVNEKNLNFLSILYPNVQLIQRGDKLKIMGKEKHIEEFDKAFKELLNIYHSEGKMNEKMIMNALNPNTKLTKEDTENNDILVHGRNGLIIKAQTPNQMQMVKSIKDNDMLFALGPAGSGKTYTAVALAVRALKAKQVKRIILTRPAVEAGENLGFLPGDLKDKLDPYLQPLYDALRDMLLQQKLDQYLEDRTIEIAPLAFMRGRTLDNAFVILDEAQNATYSQLKMFLTRMGRNAKFIITADPTQIDLPRNQPSGLKEAEKFLKKVEGIGFVYLKEYDIIRHPLVSKIVEAYTKEEKTKLK